MSSPEWRGLDLFLRLRLFDNYGMPLFLRLEIFGRVLVLSGRCERSVNVFFLRFLGGLLGNLEMLRDTYQYSSVDCGENMTNSTDASVDLDDCSDAPKGILPVPVSREELESFNWQKEIENFIMPNDRHICVIALHKRIGEFDERSKSGAILYLLSSVLSMHMALGTSSPFVAALQMSDRRSFVPEDMSVNDLEILELMAESATDPWVRARLSDVALQASKNHGRNGWRLGQIAARAYFLCSVSQAHEAVLRTTCLQRAMELGWKYMKKDTGFHDSTWISARDLLRQGLSSSSMGVVIPIAEEIKRRNKSIASEAAEALDVKAEELLTQGSSEMAVRMFQEAAGLWLAAKESVRSQLSNHRSSHALIALARMPGQAMLQSCRMAEGISMLRQNNGDKDLIKKLQLELASIRSRVPGEMSKFTHRIDISSLVVRIEESLTASALFDILLQIAFVLSTGADSKIVKSQVVENAKRFVFFGMIPRVVYSSSGVPIYVLPSFDASDEDVVEAHMVHYVSQHIHPMLGRVFIPTALDVVQRKFEPTLTDMIQIVGSSPLSPKGNIWSLSRGLLAGLEQDWKEAAVFLIPQAEAFVRALFSRANIHTLSKSNKTVGAEEEKSLNELLAHPDVNKVLSENLVLELKAILTHKAGHNLRNRYGHGLIPDYDLDNVGTVVLWWTMLRLVLCPFQDRILELRVDNSDATPLQS